MLLGEGGKQICQVTLVVAVPVTVATNGWGLPKITVGEGGVTVMPIGVELPPQPQTTASQAPIAVIAPSLRI
jgi:hypothetical protein